MDLERVDIVLVRPSRPANVAAACRAMKNMGLAHLALVGVPGPIDDPGARALAYGAWDVLDRARLCGTLEEAVGGAAVVAGSSARQVGEAWTPRRLAEQAQARSGGGRLAVVFGPESHGLTGDELRLCHVQVTVPAHPDQPSLNLAQAVLVVAYELRMASLPAVPVAPEAPRADAAALEQVLRELKAALLGIGYLNPQNPEPVLGELRRLLARAGPTPREVLLLRGLARQVAWAAARIAAGGGGSG
jgi:TrmH family RNA methyltransferase